MSGSERKSMRYAHAEGHTDVCYNYDGKYIFTCGSDGDVRYWEGIEDDDPSSECVGEIALSVAFRNEKLYVGTDNNNVQVYTFPDPKRDGIAARFTAPVTHIVMSKDGGKIVSASCDMEIQVTDTRDNSSMKLTGHTGPVLGVSLDPLLKFVVSSSCDGSIRVWSLDTSSVIKTFEKVVPLSNDFFRATTLGRSSWYPENGCFLCFPFEKQIMVYERDSWNLAFSLVDEKIKKPLSVCMFSPCGNFIAASSTSGEIIVWDIDQRRAVSYTTHPKNVCITSLAWHPTDNELAFVDALGQLGTLMKPKQESTTEQPVTSAMEEEPLSLNGFPDDDDDNAISLEKIKSSTSFHNEDSKSGMSDDGDVKSERAATPAPVFNIDHLQEAFQPTSTPIHFQHRYMLWNSIGIVKCFNTEEEKTINIEFHDTLFHHSLHKNNLEEFKMAALSHKVLALACRLAQDSPSKLTCILLNPWDGSKEWSTSLPNSEDTVALAAAGTWVAVATDTNNLRTFTYTGTQRPVISLPGPVVCMSGHDNLLFVICHGGLGLPDCQNLIFTIYEVSTFCIKTKSPWQPLPVQYKANLKWAGFSDEGTPCTCDSDGYLRAFSPQNLNWVTLCDTRAHCKGKSDHYFILGVSEQYQNIRCVLCKGSYYPMTTPRPNVVEIPLKLPLCDVDNEKTINEEIFWRNVFCLPTVEAFSNKDPEYSNQVVEMEKKLKQSVIKLFANACQSNADMRATDVASLMSEQPLQLAVKYASKLGRMYLAEKLGKLEPSDWNALKQDNASLTYNYCSVEQVREENKYNFPINGLSYSQEDIFESTTPTGAPSSTVKKILEINQDGEHEIQSIKSPFGTKPKNPFKVNPKIGDGQKGLNFFDNYKPTNNKIFKPVIDPKKFGKKMENKNKSTNENSEKKMSFVQWFAINKPSLLEEFPELSINELTKAGMKRFREETSKTGKENESQGEIKEDTVEELNSRKRKLEEDSIIDGETNKKTVVGKLSAFAFKKT